MERRMKSGRRRRKGRKIMGVASIKRAQGQLKGPTKQEIAFVRE